MTEENPPFEAVCERIAGDLAEQSYAMVDDFLTIEEVDSLLSRIRVLNNEGDLKEAGIGKAQQFQVNQEVRKDKIHWLDPKDDHAATRHVSDRLSILMRWINRTCFLGLKDFEMHLTMYPKGAYYKRHLDQFKANDHRRLTFLCYLNKNWTKEDGGLLRLYLRDTEQREKALDIVPFAGRFVCFRSDLLEHEVLICHRERYSLTGWLLDQLNDVSFLKL